MKYKNYKFIPRQVKGMDVLPFISNMGDDHGVERFIREECWSGETVFVTPEILDIMESAKVEVQNIELPYHSTIFMFPVESPYESCMLSRTPSETLNKCAKKWKIQFRSSIGNHITMYNSENYLKIRDEDISRYISVGDCPQDGTPLVPLSKDEEQAMRELFKMAGKLCLYIQCRPDKLIPGFPFEKPKNKEIRKKGKLFTLKGMEDEHSPRGPVSAHYRTGHYRFLQHERYKTPRMIYVKGCMVNRDIKPETVID